jgi:hypothetical protein
MPKTKKKPAFRFEHRPIDFTRAGRYLNGTKRGPEGHLCVFNANLCMKSVGKFWFGDLDLNDDFDDLKRLAAEKGEPIFVLHEFDARFEYETSPRYEKAIAIIKPSGETQINKGQ